MADVSKITLPNGDTYDINIRDTQKLRYPAGLANQGDIVLQSLINTQRANKLAFLPPDQIICEKTVDGGTTWTDAGVPNDIKAMAFSEIGGTMNLPQINGRKNVLCGLRVTITGMKYNVPDGTAETQKYNYWNSEHVDRTERYCNLNGMYFWLSSSNDTIGIKVERASGAKPNNWVATFNNSSFYMTGWSGWDYISFPAQPFGGGTRQSGNSWNWRITFMTLGKNGSSSEMNTGYETQFQSVSQIRGYGLSSWVASTEYSQNDKIYAHDKDKNVTFPAKVTATAFTGSGASLTNLNANNIASGTVPVARLPVATNSENGVTKLYTGANSNAENTALTPASLYNMANRSICPYYSTSATYAVGDKVRNGDYIYECITAITTAEAWTAAHWQIAPTLQEQITGLAVKSDLIFSNVNEIKSYLLTTYGNRNGEYFDFLSVAHTDTSETIMTPNNRWVGYVCKDTGGSSLIFVAHNRYGNDIKLTYSFSDQSWTQKSLSSRLEAGRSFDFTLNSSQISQFAINKMRAKIFGNIYILCLVLEPLVDIGIGEIQLGKVSVSPGLNTATVVTRNSDTKPVGGANLLENQKLYMNLTESVNQGNKIYISFATTYS